MSVQATSWVWENSTAEGNVRLVLLAIADAANREGEESCQSVPTLMAMCHLSRATIFRCLDYLKEIGEIEATRKHERYQTMVYRLPHMGSQGGSQSETPSQSDTGGGLTGETEGVSPVRPNPKELTPEEKPHVDPSSVEPLRHGSRAMWHEWMPRVAFIGDLRRRFPDVSLHQERDTFVDWYIQASKTSRSWEAMFAVWCQNKQEKIDSEKKEGTDELGVPRRQRRNGTKAAGPGDPDYIDPAEIAEAARQAALRGRNGA